jgi:hypothetical protein
MAEQRELLQDNGQQVAAIVSRLTGETLRLYQSGKVLKAAGKHYVCIHAAGAGRSYESILAEFAPPPIWWVKLFVHPASISRRVERGHAIKWRKRAGDKGVVIHGRRGHHRGA